MFKEYNFLDCVFTSIKNENKSDVFFAMGSLPCGDLKVISKLEENYNLFIVLTGAATLEVENSKIICNLQTGTVFQLHPYEKCHIKTNNKFRTLFISLPKMVYNLFKNTNAICSANYVGEIFLNKKIYDQLESYHSIIKHNNIINTPSFLATTCQLIFGCLHKKNLYKNFSQQTIDFHNFAKDNFHLNINFNDYCTNNKCDETLLIKEILNYSGLTPTDLINHYCSKNK
ncbi:hypothetical protein AAEX28_11395 [Lentisphaerota bacterium WC36G]|nr:hypothetical protein LJT99_14230 [Lentisphaerae bacterium WC36]